MPHIIVEYTANIRDDARIPVLLKTINETLIAQGGVFPTGGIRSRAIELQDYCVADGTADDAFVHVTLKIGSGRDDATKKAACDALFDAIKAHFAALYERRYLALSMELAEFSETGSYKHNNIHARYRRGA
ncbi:5-carboxymethyl-2-hydroxymuconate Delta-isomerase [Burkholderia thailandensis]|uniref:5-carboxymethyl-2-hydroxymuconate isomerase family protein n=2 Tax=Burkholderia thailandensis TaxID=57975 RepID=A0AAW9CUJ7_BURTH|nr:5-carboxymethyl-2-hydroxymuconate Delta-isomerase [Burkholderia thailandensis]ABC34312.1 5-carboxymethyl-2-hydroxymuconate delta isomerase [Burkholderia thailandensis E264]AHI67669.1 5-carboxymethyl-2-hydroxymuconate isomerase family protein [Burkholderia thailandensis H0587]AHI77122.1 5-carboxymethyl-2-hydroxymuconate Delta-isomerase [Burkholderia thailandensis 2002721723]AHI81445.1 5-carboxymethyl-2-hydroxymuconate Delta-isomerase [Burkholderia thailandensis E444]AIC89966.1 5-carboxymethy